MLDVGRDHMSYISVILMKDPHFGIQKVLLKTFTNNVADGVICKYSPKRELKTNTSRTLESY